MSIAKRVWSVLHETEVRVPGSPDAWLLGGIIVLNPFVWGWALHSSLTPDVIAYVSFAENGIATGKLYLPAWGHVDVGAILPPLYPSLIAIANLIDSNSIANGMLINGAAMVLMSVCLFFCVKRVAGVWAAAAAALLVQANWHYLYFGSNVLTEPLFLLLTTCTLTLLVQRVVGSRRDAWIAAALGVLAGLAFLARQIGLVLLGFILVWLIVEYSCDRRNRSQTLRDCLLVAGVWAAVVLPLAALLYYQTGASPLEQSVRLNNYVVYADDVSALEAPQEGATDYVEVYRKRRELRTLLPSGAEMLAYAVPKSGAPSRQANTSFPPNLNPRSLISNFATNLALLVDRLGAVPVWGAAIAMLSALFAPSSSVVPRAARLVLPGFIVCYVIVVSSVSGAIARYFTVLFPLLFAVIATEVGLALQYWLHARHRLLAAAIGIAVLAVMLASTPKFWKGPLTTRAAQSEQLVRRPAVESSQPMFSLLPAYAYMAGGSYRVLPNDSLERVVHYGQLTGVRWLLVPEDPKDVIETHFYANAPWLAAPHSLLASTKMLRYCCTLEVLQGRHLLFEILPRTGPEPPT